MAADKGWAWVVLVACFLNFFLCGWFTYTVGVVHVVLLEVFQEDIALTSWVGAINSSLMALAGPLASYFINKYNCRVCAVLGGILIFVGYSASAFMTSITSLIVTYGIIAGTGTGLAYSPCVIAVGYHFEKYRGIATGVAMTGAGLGMLSGGPVMRCFLDAYGLPGAYLLIGAIGSNVCVMGMLMRPSKYEKTKDKRITFSSVSSKNSKVCLLENINPCGRYLNILKNRALLCHCFSIFAWNIGQSTLFLHLPYYAESKGTSPDASAALLTGVGALSMTGRLLTGMVVTKQEIDGLIMHMGMLGAAGILIVLFPLFSYSYAGQMIFSCLVGFYTAGPIVLLNALTVELAGVDNLATAFGVETLFLGVGYLIGPPIAGMIVDSGASYDVSFIFAGLTVLVAALVTLGTAAFHGKSTGPVDPAIFGSFAVINVDVSDHFQDSDDTTEPLQIKALESVQVDDVHKVEMYYHLLTGNATSEVEIKSCNGWLLSEGYDVRGAQDIHTSANSVNTEVSDESTSTPSLSYVNQDTVPPVEINKKDSNRFLPVVTYSVATAHSCASECNELLPDLSPLSSTPVLLL